MNRELVQFTSFAPVTLFQVVPPYKDDGVSDWVTTAGLVGTVLLIAYFAVMLCLQERKFGGVMR